MAKLIIVLSIIFIFFVVVAIFLTKKLTTGKNKNTKADLKCTIFTTIISPILTIISLIIVVYTLQIQTKDSKQNYYDTEFSFLFNEMKSFINDLSVEVKYNQYLEEPVIIEKLQVVDELAYYLKRNKYVRRLITTDMLDDNDVKLEENAWFTAEVGDFYSENGKYYIVEIRPEIECEYFEMINKRFRNIFIPIFELLKNKDNEHQEMHKHLFASYMSKNIFEAYLTPRWEKQDIPDEKLLFELYKLSY